MIQAVPLAPQEFLSHFQAVCRILKYAYAAQPIKADDFIVQPAQASFLCSV
jgi:hypothetical protein